MPLLPCCSFLAYHDCRVLKSDTRKKGVIAAVVKDYLNKKKAEREAERARAHTEARTEHEDEDA